MAPRKSSTVAEPAVEEQASYALEPLTDDIRSKLNVWGNSTKIAINQLEADAPGWAELIRDMFNVVGATVELMS